MAHRLPSPPIKTFLHKITQLLSVLQQNEYEMQFFIYYYTVYSFISFFHYQSVDYYSLTSRRIRQLFHRQDFVAHNFAGEYLLCTSLRFIDLLKDFWKKLVKRNLALNNKTLHEKKKSVYFLFVCTNRAVDLPKLSTNQPTNQPSTSCAYILPSILHIIKFMEKKCREGSKSTYCRVVENRKKE